MHTGYTSMTGKVAGEWGTDSCCNRPFSPAPKSIVRSPLRGLSRSYGQLTGNAIRSVHRSGWCPSDGQLGTNASGLVLINDLLFTASPENKLLIHQTP